jgi:hypothetical protein
MKEMMGWMSNGGVARDSYRLVNTEVYSGKSRKAWRRRTRSRQYESDREEL